MHGFAMQHEAGEDLETDDFYWEGLIIIKDERRQHQEHAENAEEYIDETERQQETARDVELLQAWLFRETLKKELFNHLDV